MPQAPPTMALSGCDIERATGGLVEITEAAPHDRCFPDRVTESFGVCLKEGPAHQVIVNGRTVVYPAGAICVREPGCIWSTRSTGQVGFLSLDIDTSLLPSDTARGAMVFVAPTILPDLRVLGRRISTGETPEAVEEIVAGLVLALGGSGLIRADELRETAPARVSRRVRDMLEADLGRPPSLAQLAADNGISRFALLRQFRREFGVTPHAFVLRLRIDRARDRLARGDDLAGTALALGFADQPHFSRVFKRIVGIAPGGYARRARRLVPVGWPAISFKNRGEASR